MGTRDKEVLNMQLTLIPILAKAWNMMILNPHHWEKYYRKSS